MIETRGGVAGHTLEVVDTGRFTALVDGEAVSLLSGELRDWVLAHLNEVGTADVRGALSDGVLTLTSPEGVRTIQVTPITPVAPLPTPPATVPIVPVADLPTPPRTAAEWTAAITAAPPIQLPVLEPAHDNETLASYTARVLAPLGAIAAQLGQHPDILTAVAPQPAARAADWNAFIQAVRPPTTAVPSGAPLPPDSPLDPQRP
jgi:hypothetical protein